MLTFNRLRRDKLKIVKYVVGLFFLISSAFASEGQSAYLKHKTDYKDYKEEAVALKQKNNDFVITDVHGFVQLGTNHVWRGISFSYRAPELVGALFYTHPTGVYAGLLAFNNFLTFGGIGEVPILGIKNEINRWIYDISARYEHYPKYDVRVIPDIFELYGKLGYKILDNLKIFAGLGYSPDYYFRSGIGWYSNARLEIGLPSKFKVDGGIGYQTTQDGAKPGNLWHKNTIDWDIGISRDFVGFVLGFRYTDTNVSRRQCNGTLICTQAYDLYVLKTF
jgi:uncharacterized protein (TIGR02001 family)